MLDRVRHVENPVKLLVDLKLYLLTLPSGATDEQKVGAIGSRMGSELLALNKCPDFEVNRGHYFGTGVVPETRAQRQRQTRADRVFEDVLAAP